MIDYNEEWSEVSIETKVRMKRVVKVYITATALLSIGVIIGAFF